MVSIVAGSGLGIFNTSRQVLGAAGQMGSSGVGRGPNQVQVNASNGNLVLSARDDMLAGLGPDVSLIRTYNSQGLLNDDNADNWRLGLSRKVSGLTGTINTAGSTIKRLREDGFEAVYTYDTARARYVNTDGAGAYDTLSLDAGTNRWIWTDGDTRMVERYDNANGGRLVQVADPDGNLLTVGYNAAGLVNVIGDQNGETVYVDYDTAVGRTANITQIRTVTSTTQTRVRYGYDTANRLTSVTTDLTPADNSVADAKTFVTSYTYDGSSNRVASLIQSDGTRLDFTYITVGTSVRVQTIVDVPLARTTTFTYDTTTRKTTVTDPAGGLTVFSYDASDRLLSVAAPAVGTVAQTTSFAYDASGNVTSATDARGNVTVYGYDTNGNRILERDAMGNTVQRVYSADSQLQNEIVFAVPDPDGAGAALPTEPKVTRYVYDAKNHLRFTIGALGDVVEQRYNALGQRVTSIVYAGAAYATSGLTSLQTLTEAQLVTWVGSASVALAERTDFQYNTRGQISRQTRYTSLDASGNGVSDGSQGVLTYVYSQAGELLQTIDEARASELADTDTEWAKQYRGVLGYRNATTQAPKLTAELTAAEKTALRGLLATSYTYDGLGRLLSQASLDGSVLTSYDDANRTVKITQAGGRVVTQVYDAAGAIVSQSQTASSVNLAATSYVYDGRGLMRLETDPLGNKTLYLFDAAGRQVGVVDATGMLTETVYNANNQVSRSITYAAAVDATAWTGALAAPKTATLAALRPAAANADNRISYSIYNAAGQMVKTVDGTGAVTEYKYDGRGRRVETVGYASVLTPTQLAALAALTTEPAASNAVPALDTANDRRERSFYDDEGRLQAKLDAEGYLHEYFYDNAGRATQTLHYATPTLVANRATGALSLLRPGTVADDQKTINLYNGKGQLEGVVDAEGYLTEFRYDNTGNRAAVTRYSTKITYLAGKTAVQLRPVLNAEDQTTSTFYDGLNRVFRQTTPEGALLQYTYDTDGRLKTSSRGGLAAEEIRVSERIYDGFGRLVAELVGENREAYLAEWTTRNVGLTPVQQQALRVELQGKYATNVAYDDAGRKISATDPNGRKTLFYYDAEDRLVATVNAAGEVVLNDVNTFGQTSVQRSFTKRLSTSALSALTGGALTPALRASFMALLDTTVDRVDQYTYTRRGEISAVAHALVSDGRVDKTYTAFGDLRTSDTYVSSAQTLTSLATYDRRGLQVKLQRDQLALNITTQSEYDAFGRETKRTDALGGIAIYKYDRLGRTLEVKDPGASVRKTTYDAHGRVLTQIDANLQVTTTVYNTAARTMTVTTPEGVVVTRTTNRHGEVISVKDGRNNTTSYAYDRSGRQTGVTTPAGTRATVYDRAGLTVETRDENNVKTVYTFDAVNRVLTRTVDPTGVQLVTTMRYDGQGRALWNKDANGVWTQTEYDSKAQIKAITVDPKRGPDWITGNGDDNPSGVALRTTFTYDGRGLRLSVVEGVGTAQAKTTQYVYDVLGRRTEQRVDPSGLNLRTQYAYDKNDNVVTVTDPTGAVTRYVYNAANRPIYVVDAIGGVTMTEYDAEWHVVKETSYATPISLITPSAMPAAPTATDVSSRLGAPSAADRVQRSVFDRDGRLAYSIDALIYVTTRTYDLAGNVVRTVRSGKPIVLPATLSVATVSAAVAITASATLDRVERSVFDAANRLVYQIDALGYLVKNTYDAVGRIVKTTAYAKQQTVAGNPTVSQVDVALILDAQDRTSRGYFDGAGRQVYIVDALGNTVEQQFDALGRVVKTIAYPVAIAPTDATTLAGVKALVPATVPANAVVTYSAYDAAGRGVFAINALGYVTEMRYDPVGRVTGTTLYASAITPPAVASAANVRGAVAGQAGAGANIINTFNYDLAGRLGSTVDAEGKTEQFTYDGNGNKLTVTNKKSDIWTYSYDALGRQYREVAPAVPVTTLDGSLNATVTQVAIETRTGYDAFGNVNSRTEAFGRPEARTTFYDYDLRGQQVKIRYPQVSVYNTAADKLDQASGAARIETSVVPTVTIVQDGLGQAVVNTDTSGNYSYKVYDLAGRIQYEIDAEGYVSYLTYDAFDNKLTTTRMATRLLQNGHLANNPYTIAEVQTALALLTTAQRADDRTITNTFDKLNRLTKVVEPSAYNYDPSSTTGTYFTAGRQTVNAYDFRGNLVKQSMLKNSVDNSWIETTYYFDKTGQRTAQVDAQGYLTVYQFDKSGYQTTKIEYAQALAGGSWNTTTYGAPATNLPGQPGANADIGYDRVTNFVYDKLGRNTQEIRRNIQYSQLSGSSISVNQGFVDATIVRAYDAVGNQVSSTDAKGNVTYTYYDALGRTRAVVEPARIINADNSQSVLPATEFGRDAFGNVVRQKSYANGASGADAGNYALNGADAARDKTQYAFFDSHGRQTQTFDALGHYKGFSYYASGSVAREWEAIADIDGKLQNKVLVYRYDRLGNQTEIIRPSSVATTVLPVFSPSGTNDAGKLLDEYGLIVNAFHDETGRGNYFNTSSGTSEGQFILLRGAINSFQTTGDVRWKTIAEKMASNLLQALYFTDDVPTAPSEKNLFTPHWLYAVKSDFVSDEIHYDKSFDFVNGEVIIPDGGDTHGDLIRNVFHARSLNSEYVWDNPYSDLKTAPGARKIEILSREHIAGVGEKIKLAENFTGRMLLTYTSQTGEVIHKGEPYEAWPYWHKLGPNEVDSALDTLVWAYDTFNALYSMTGDTKWQNAAVATKVTADVAYRYDDGRSWIRPTVGNTPFDLGGTFKYVTPGRAEPNWSRDADGQAVIDIPSDIGDVQYGLGLDQVLDGGAITVEIGSDRPMTVEIFIDTEQGNYLSRRTVILNLNGTGVQTFNLTLAQFKPAYKPNGERQTIAVRDASAGIAAGAHAWALGVLVTGFPASPPITAGKITFRKMRPATQTPLTFSPYQVAGSPWLYRTNTSNGFDIPGTWSYASRNNGGTSVPVNWTRNYDGDISATMAASTGGEAQYGLGLTQALAGNAIVLQANSTIAQSVRVFLDPIQGDYAARRSVTVQLDGKGLQQIVIPLSAFGLATGTTVYTVGISDEATAAHTLTIKQLSQYSSGAAITYAPAAIPFTANMTGDPQQLIGWRGPIYMGYQSPTMWSALGDSSATASLLSLLKASQNDYAQKTGQSGPFAPVFYPNRSDGEQYGPAGTFGWGGPDPNSQWGGYQYRPLEDTARYWSTNPGNTTAQSVVMGFLGWLNNVWTDPAKYPPTDFPQNLSAWTAGTSYKAGDVVRSHNKNGLVYRAVNSGSSAGTPPAWSTTMNAQFTDGGITWQVIGYDYGSAFGAYPGPHEVALMLRAAVYADLAGGDRAITRPLIARALAFLEARRSAGDMLGTWSADPAAKNWYGFWSGEIATTLSLLLTSGSSILSGVGFAASKLTTWLSDSAAWILNNSSTQNNKLGFFQGTKDQSAYNAFGEIVAKGRNDEWQETYKYDAAGRMWSGNSGGVAQIYLYNLAGQATAKIESATQDLRGYVAPQVVAALTTDVRRTNTVYDNLGRAVNTTQPSFKNVSEGTATLARVDYGYDRWNNVISATDARNTSYVTNYRYDSSNQLVAEIKPTITVWQQSGINVTAAAMRPTNYFGYDLLGRRVFETDANGISSLHELNAAGNALRHYYADGGSETYQYDAFGRKTYYKDGVGNVTYYAYDRNDRLVNLTLPIGSAQYTYDAVGNLIQETNANGTRKYWFDINSRMIKSTLPGGQSTTYEYDAGGNKIKEVGVNSDVSTSRYDYFGRLQASRDIGGADASYVYNWAGQVVKTTNSRGQSLDYVYYENGLLQRVYDNSLDGIGNTTRRAGETLYEYDAAGNVKHERFTLNGTIYKDSTTAYDLLGRISGAVDPFFSVSYRYDAVGNRRSVTSSYANANFGVPTTVDNWYLFDARNRTVLTQGLLLGNTVMISATQGAIMTYDLSGYRTTMTYQGPVGGPNVDWYNYDALHRLTATLRNTVIVSAKTYDEGGRVILAVNNNDDGTVKDFQVNSYNANGWIKSTASIVKGPNGNDTRLDYQYTIDASGNIASYALVAIGAVAYNDLFQYQYLKTTSYQQLSVSANRWTNSASPLPGGTRTTYDANGNATGLIDSRDITKTSTYAADYAGRIYNKQSIGKTERYFYVNGEQVGSNAGRGASDFGYAESAMAAPSDAYFTAVSERYPATSPTTYTVQAGDTLKTIAYTEWGDSSLWYLIAEANGISGDSDLAGMVGRLIDIPNQITNRHNNADTIRPYSASDIHGNTTPNLPTPLPAAGNKGGCGGLGMIVVAIVAIVVTIYTAGAAASVFGAAAAGTSTGVGATGAAVFAGGLTAAGGASVGFGTYFAAAAVGSAAGSIVSQGVGIAMGLQDKFSWSAVASGAISSGIGAGVTGILGQAGLAKFVGENATAQVMAGAAIQNAIGQGVAIAVGAQKRFDWRGVASSAIAAPLAKLASDSIGKAVDQAVGNAFGGLAAQAAQRATSALTYQSVSLMLHKGGKLNAVGVIADAFGNAIGSSLVAASTNGSIPGPVSADERSRIMGYFADGPGDDIPRVNGLTFSQDAGMRQMASDPLGIRQMIPVPVQSRQMDDTRVIRDFDPNNEMDGMPGPMGDGDGTQVAGGSVRVMRGNAVGRGGVNVLDPVPSTINGVSVNQRADALFQGVADLAGAGDMYRDIKLIGALMSDREQQNTIDRLKGTLQDKLGMMRVLPSEADLGAIQGVGSDGVSRYDKQDLIDRYSDANRKVELMKAGVIELDTRSMLITSIGTAKLAPDQWVGENTQRYQAAFAAGVDRGQELYDAGKLRYRLDMPEQLQVGLFADDAARTAVIRYNREIGVPEGAGQLLSMNRWSYDPSGSGNYNRIDLLMDLGPSRNGGALILRTAIEGKSSLEAVQSSGAQLQRVQNWVTPRVYTATPQGTQLYIPRRLK